MDGAKLCRYEGKVVVFEGYISEIIYFRSLKSCLVIFLALRYVKSF